MDFDSIEESEDEGEEEQQAAVGFIQKFREIRDEHTSAANGRSTPQGSNSSSASRYVPKSNNSASIGSSIGGMPWLKHEVLK